MRRFTQLYCEIDESNRTSEKVAALERYFREAPPEDAVWALFFLTGARIPRPVNSTLLREYTAQESGFPEWLVEECHEAVGDLAETLALLHPGSGEGTKSPLHELVEQCLQPLKTMSEPQRRDLLHRLWHEFTATERFLWNKLMLGNFRVGVSRTLVVRALAAVAGIAPAEMANRLMGHWEPTPEDFRRIMAKESDSSDLTRPYPFFLAHPLTQPSQELGALEEWQVEWKWDGIRAQLIRRRGEILVWSRGQELITDRFPEIAMIGQMLPNGTVLDGEILAWRDDRPLPFALLQQRIGRKTVGKKLLAEAPAALVVYDILEHEGRDIRSLSLAERRHILEQIVLNLRGAPIHLSPLAKASSWSTLAELREESRTRGVEGFMLKRRSSPYGVGRTRGDWWKWKIDPYTIDAVMIYAQRGSGRRASLYTDYTFGLWHEGQLVPVAKAYSGLTNAEIQQVDAWVRRNSLEKHGPVRVVKPELVFELAFEGIQKSARHKSGLAVRFPRIKHWRSDKKPQDADHLETLRKLAE